MGYQSVTRYSLCISTIFTIAVPWEAKGARLLDLARCRNESLAISFNARRGTSHAPVRILEVLLDQVSP